MLFCSNAGADAAKLSQQDGRDCMLVIVDMQDRYPASRCRKVRQAVANEITTAKAKGWWVVVLEFGGTCPHVPTHSELSSLLLNCDRCSEPLIKNEPDGSRLVKSFCRQRLLNPKRIRVCGVNIGACVHATVDGLIAEFGQAVVEVVKKACNCTSPAESWQHFMKHPRVWIV